MGGLKFPQHENIIAGFENSEDAGVYRTGPDTAIVQTVDFITPVVDDPYTYGCIAAANSLSDIFAMGARVLTALNIVAYDSCNVTRQMLSEILQGGIDKVAESGGVILGGHTVEDMEMKYGLSVTGIVHPEMAVRNNTAKPGDKLIITKPVGSGVITTAWKGDLCEKKHIDKAAEWMSVLNKKASEAAVLTGVNAMTDITGFGLAGHLIEMTGSAKGADLFFNSLPLMEGAMKYAAMMLFPGGSVRNEKYFGRFFLTETLNETERMILFDAQTSGGLLIAVCPSKADELLDRLHNTGVGCAAVIGEINDHKGNITVVK